MCRGDINCGDMFEEITAKSVNNTNIVKFILNFFTFFTPFFYLIFFIFILDC